MFCPQCHVEYRPGFTHCADCDVELVHVQPAAQQDAAAWATATWQRTAQGRTYHEQLWRGSDPHFYLSLVGALGGKDIPCVGRPTTLPLPRFSGDEDGGTSFEEPEFEVRVSEMNKLFAVRILQSTQEDYGKEWPVEEPEKDEEGKSRGPGSYVCPLCSAEFREANSLCPNCNVHLLTSEAASLPENSPRFLVHIPHPLFFSMLTKALRAEGIPFSNSNFFDYNRILGFQFVPSHRVLVLARVLQHWEIEPGAGLRRVQETPQTYRSSRAMSGGWLPEDLDARVWSGKNVNTLEFVAVVLQEHGIAYRIVDEEQEGAAVFVHSVDQDDAARLVQEILQNELTA